MVFNLAGANDPSDYDMQANVTLNGSLVQDVYASTRVTARYEIEAATTLVDWEAERNGASWDVSLYLNGALVLTRPQGTLNVNVTVPYSDVTTHNGDELYSLAIASGGSLAADGEEDDCPFGNSPSASCTISEAGGAW